MVYSSSGEEVMYDGTRIVGDIVVDIVSGHRDIRVREDVRDEIF
jgi:hypothetical protein